MISEMEIGLGIPDCFSSFGSQSSSILTNQLHPHIDPTVLCNCQPEPLGSATVPPAGCSGASSLCSSSSLKSKGVGSQGLLSQTSFHTDEETEVQKQSRVTTKVRIQKFMLSPQFVTLETLVYIQFSLLWDGTQVAP